MDAGRTFVGGEKGWVSYQLESRACWVSLLGSGVIWEMRLSGLTQSVRETFLSRFIVWEEVLDLFVGE